MGFNAEELEVQRQDAEYLRHEQTLDLRERGGGAVPVISASTQVPDACGDIPRHGSSSTPARHRGYIAPRGVGSFAATCLGCEWTGEWRGTENEAEGDLQEHEETLQIQGRTA